MAVYKKIDGTLIPMSGGTSNLESLLNVNVTSASLDNGNILLYDGSDWINSGILCSIESSPSTTAYSVGDLLIYNDAVYYVYADIAIDDTLSTDVNLYKLGDTILEAIQFVLSENKNNLSELNDVDLTTTPSDGQVLTFDDTTSKWTAKSQSSGEVSFEPSNTTVFNTDGSITQTFDDSGNTLITTFDEDTITELYINENTNTSNTKVTTFNSDGSINVTTTSSTMSSQTITLSDTEITLTDVSSPADITVSTSGNGTLSVISSDTDVATATISDGTITITAVADGDTTITVTASATATYKKATATINVTVSLS